MLRVQVSYYCEGIAARLQREPGDVEREACSEARGARGSAGGEDQETPSQEFSRRRPRFSVTPRQRVKRQTRQSGGP